jgi:AAA domain
VLIVLEESGRAALHRRLDMLTRGRAIRPEALSDFHYSANRRVKLDTEEWRERLRETAQSKPWRLIAFDPYARLKGFTDEDSQKESGPLLDFFRELRDLIPGTVFYNAHTGHEGTRQRGSSDFESYYETKITLLDKSGKQTLTTEHREAEATGPFDLSLRFDHKTRTVRIDADEDELSRKVREHLEEHPDDSANSVVDAVGGNRTRVLELVNQRRLESGSESLEPPGTSSPGQRRDGGSRVGLYEAPGTTPTDPPIEVVPNDGNHLCVEVPCQAPRLPGSLYCRAHGGTVAECSHDAFWQARDGCRRCVVCEPPAFPSEVVA